MLKTKRNSQNIARLSKKDSQTTTQTILGSLKRSGKRLLFKVKNITLLPESKKPSFVRLGFAVIHYASVVICVMYHIVTICATHAVHYV